ncbi:hypothetical protein IJI31_06395, partial [bacterium]|nr:hypothetical protein [bacterium]
MGMSASQVRLLTITKRIHTVENEAERIQNQKMLLGLQSDEAYEEYLAAMEKKNIEYAFFDGEQGNFDWDKLNIAKLFTQGYQLKVRVPGLVDHDTMTKTVTVDVTHSFNPNNTVTKSGVAPQLDAQTTNGVTTYVPSQNEDGTISIKQGNDVVANISADDAEDFIAYYAAHPSDDPDGFACQVTVGENVYNAVYYPA